MREDFRMWRRNATPEEMPRLERWISALIRKLLKETRRF